MCCENVTVLMCCSIDRWRGQRCF